MKGRILRRILGIFIVILMTSQSSFAQVYQHPHSIGLSNDQYVILLVGLKQHELAESERTMLHGKKIIEVIRAGNWVDAVGKAQAQEIIVRHNSGFAGLYTPAGNLVRPIELADGSNPIQQETRTGAVRDQPFLELRNQTGYQTGGPIDPYRHQQFVDKYTNNARLSPGWGYNSNYDKPRSRRSAVVDALNFMPYDTTTPLNYAAQFGGSPALSTGYALGVVPHFIGLIARMKRGQAERDDYTYYKREQGMPNYLDSAPDYYYQGAKNEPSNPITTDPNFVRYDNAPQAFQQAYPGFGANHGPQQVPNFNPGNPYLGG